MRAAAAAHPQVQIAETGDATIDKAVNDTIFRDLHRAEALSLPITLVVLLIAFGAVVALFQWGWGQSVFGFTSTHSVASWLPLFLFLVLFGPSMDYQVSPIGGQDHRRDQRH